MIEIHPADTYRASAWIRVKKGHARIQISYLSEHKWLGSSDGAQRVVIDEWQQVNVESDPNKFVNVTQLHIAIVSDGPDVEVYVDDVEMALLDAKLLGARPISPNGWAQAPWISSEPGSAKVAPGSYARSRRLKQIAGRRDGAAHDVL